MADARSPRRFVAAGLRRLAIVAAVAVGVSLVLIPVTIGHCSAFGGRCPADPEPLLDDDTFGMAAVGAAIAFGTPMMFWALARQATWRRVGMALATSAAFGVVVGLAVRSAANG